MSGLTSYCTILHIYSPVIIPTSDDHLDYACHHCTAIDGSTITMDYRDGWRNKQRDCCNWSLCSKSVCGWLGGFLFEFIGGDIVGWSGDRFGNWRMIESWAWNLLLWLLYWHSIGWIWNSRAKQADLQSCQTLKPHTNSMGLCYVSIAK